MPVAQKHHSLLLLRLPGNVEREIYQLKNDILRKTGAVSTQMPPILPIADVHAELTDSAVDTLSQREIRPVRFGPIAETNGFIVLGAGFWTAYWDRDSRTWHDKMLGTYVVDENSWNGDLEGSSGTGAKIVFWITVPLLVLGTLYTVSEALG